MTVSPVEPQRRWYYPKLTMRDYSRRYRALRNVIGPEALVRLLREFDGQRIWIPSPLGGQVFLRMLRDAGCEDPLRASLALVELNSGRRFLWLPVAPGGKTWTMLVHVLGPQIAECLQSAYGGRGVHIGTSDMKYRSENPKRSHIERIIGAAAATKLFAGFGGDWLDVPAGLDSCRDRKELRRVAVEMRRANGRISEITTRLHVSRSTIFRWLRGPSITSTDVQSPRVGSDPNSEQAQTHS